MVAPDIEAVAPSTSSSQSLVAGTNNWTTTVVGTTPSWLSVRARTMADGSFLTAADQASAASVVVLGSTTAEELFGTTDVVGQSVTIAGTPFTVEGVLAASGSSGSSSGSSNNDDTAVIPLSTAQQRVSSGSSRTSVQTIYVAGGVAGRPCPPPTRRPTTSSWRCMASRRATGADFTITNQASLVTTAASVVQDADRAARRDRSDLVARRRDRRHEHHARLGHRADPRDRSAQGARRPTPR